MVRAAAKASGCWAAAVAFSATGSAPLQATSARTVSAASPEGCGGCGRPFVPPGPKPPLEGRWQAKGLTERCCRWVVPQQTPPRLLGTAPQAAQPSGRLIAAPTVRTGTCQACRGRWSGLPLRQAAAGLLRSLFLPQAALPCRPHRPEPCQRPLLKGAVAAEGRLYRRVQSLPLRGGGRPKA